MPNAFNANRTRRYATNAALVVASLLLVALMIRTVDWAAGALNGPVTAEIIFPANAEVEYTMLESSSVARTNNLGFRGPDCPPKSQRRRVVFIGDSFTFGWGVNLEDTWIHRAERQLRDKGHDIELLNLGAPGAGPAQYCVIAERALPVLRPDLVIVVLHLGDDLWQSEQPAPPQTTLPSNPATAALEWIAPNLLRFARRGNAYLSPGDFRIDSVNRAWREQFTAIYERLDAEQKARFEKADATVQAALREGKLNPWRMLMFMSSATFDSALLDADSATMRRREQACALWLRRIKALGAEYACDTAVIALPGADWTDRRVWECSRALGRPSDPRELTTTAPDTVAERAAKRAGVHCISATAYLREKAREDTLYFLYDTHFNAKGNGVFAEFVAETLEKLN